MGLSGPLYWGAIALAAMFSSAQSTFVLYGLNAPHPADSLSTLGGRGGMGGP